MPFIGSCFKTVINKLVRKRPQITSVEKKILILSLRYLGDISLETRTRLRTPFKGILNCCKLQIVFKSQRKLANVFRFKDLRPFDLVNGKVYRCDFFLYGKTDIHLKVRSREHIRISPLIFRKVKPSKESAIRDHILFDNNIASFDEFTVLAYGHHKYTLGIKETLLIKRDRPVLN